MSRAAFAAAKIPTRAAFAAAKIPTRAAFAAAKIPTRAALVAAIALTLAACSAGGDTKGSDSLTVTDAWAKAADSSMTAAFGEITNSSAHDITIVAASSPAATEVQMHEVVDSTMRKVDGGLVIPAGQTRRLQPGGFHLMFIGLTAPIKAGDVVSLTLTFDDDSQLTFTAVAKDFTGANESYDAGMSMSPSASMGG